MIRADKTFINGRIYTMVKEEERVEALVVLNGKIIYAGSNEEAKKYPTEATIDLEGKTVLPGMTDSHIHLVMDCEAKQKVALNDATCVEDIVDAMKAREGQLAPGVWLQGMGLHIERMKDDKLPTRYELDQISKDRPILIQTYCGHATMVNSKALEMAGIGKGFKTEVEGIVELDDQGVPTGITRENAYNDYFEPLAGETLPTYVLKKEAIAKGLRECASYGITCVQTYSSFSGEPLEYLYQYKDLDEEGRLPARIVMNSSAPLPKMIGAVTGIGNDKIMYGAKKIFSDGSLSSHSAALLEPYSDDPEMSGVVLFTQEDLNGQIKEAHEYGMEVAIHAIGDKAMEMVITAIENAFDPNAGRKNRFRIIHAMMPAPGHIERIKKLPVILDIQPVFIRNWVRLCESRIGPERMQRFMPLRTYIDNGIILTGGSDAPVEEINPFIGIQCAVTRQDLGGYPEAGFVPEERITVFEAVSMFTKNAAYCTNQENIRGTLEAGKFADFAVLDEDIFQVDPSEIYKIKVLKTILGGDEVYSL